MRHVPALRALLEVAGLVRRLTAPARAVAALRAESVMRIIDWAMP